MILHGPSRPDFLTDIGLPDVLEATVARQPDRPALYWGEHSASVMRNCWPGPNWPPIT